MIEHLYPARAELLRMGTPAASKAGQMRHTKLGTVIHPSDGGAFIYTYDSLSRRGQRVWCGMRDLYVDLSDVTGRIHAAMPYTLVVSGQIVCVIAGQRYSERYRQAATLAAMRRGERLPYDQMRLALDWAAARVGERR